MGEDRTNRFFSLRFLRWFCPPHMLEEIEGDLLQKFEKNVKAVGERKAKRKLLWNTIRFFRPGIILRNRYSFHKIFSIMWYHYMITYLRNASKSKVSTILNIAGLVIGLASALTMSLFIESELQADRFSGSENIYRVVFGQNDNSGSAFTPYVLGTELKSNYPGVRAVRFNNAGNARAKFKRGDKQFIETAFYFTDAEALTVFPFRLLEGEASSCLSQPFTIILNKRAAQKYFGNENPIGQTISLNWIDQDYELKITGLIDETSYHSHIAFDYLISISTAERLFQPQSFFTDWTANYNVTYLSIENNITAELINSELNTIYQSRNDKVTSDFSNLRLQPLNQIHLYSHLSREISTNSDIKYLWLAAGIGILILAVCLINYANLMTAMFTLRLKEVGVRKSLGAGRFIILRQFLMESVTNVILALIIALALVTLSAPYLANQFGIRWTFEQLLRVPGVWISIIALLGVGIMAGGYPSIMISGQNAGDILYGRIKLMIKGTWVKNSLVILQLFIAFIILVGALVARNQLVFMQHKELGYTKESILTVPHGRSIRDRTEAVKQHMEQSGSIISSTLSSQLPSRSLGYKVPAIVEGGNPDGSDDAWPVSVVSVDFDFFTTFGLQLKEGRTFSTQFPTDSTEGFVINGAMARELNWAQPIGKEIEMTYNVGDGTVETRKGRVIGVINDFNFESLHKTIEPVVFIFKSFWFYYITFKLKPGIAPNDIEMLSENWKSVVPDVPFEFTFMTDRLEQLYLTERAWASGINFFSVIAIGISSLGLLGLMSFLVQSKMREIAIRKVLGAESWSVFLRLYTSMLVLIALAALAAFPVAWYTSRLWLNSFAYRIDIGSDVFLVSLAIIVLVSTLAVAGRILQAATLNPVNILKTE